MSADKTDPQSRLFEAARRGDTEAVVAALAEGASPWAIDARGLTPLKVAVVQSTSLPCVMELIQAEIDQPRGALQSFCDLAWLKVKKIWSDTSSQDLAQNSKLSNASRSALHWAIRAGKESMAIVLLDHCDPKQPDMDGVFPLSEAASHGMKELVRRLLSRVDPKAQDANGDTALMRAAKIESMESIRLLAPVSDLAAVNAKGETALCAAVGGTGSGQSVDFLSTASNDATLVHALNLLEPKEGQEPYFGIERPDRLNVLRVKLEARRLAKAASNPSPAAPNAPRAGL